MNNSLQALQQDFQQYLLGNNQAMIAEVIDSSNLDARKRLNIYQEAYVSRLLEALESDFPVLAELLGSKIFHRLGLGYIEKHPSTYRSIRHFGKNFPAFLLTQTTYNKAHFWSELAQFEWALITAFDAENSGAISAADMQRIPPEKWGETCFQLSNSCQFCHFSWNTVAVWQAIKAGKKKSIKIINSTSSSAWIIWRKQLETYFRSMDLIEAQALKSLASGLSLGEICENLSQGMEEEKVVLHAATLLKTWIAEDLIREININLKMCKPRSLR